MHQFKNWKDFNTESGAKSKRFSNTCAVLVVIYKFRAKLTSFKTNVIVCLIIENITTL